MSFQTYNSRFIFKVIIFGDSGVGKSTLSKRLEKNIFFPDLKKTIGVNFYVKSYILDNVDYVLQIWDFSGESQFMPILPFWLRGTSGGVFVFDLTNRKTLFHLRRWLNLLSKYKELNQFPIIMVGTKNDLIEERRVPETKAKNIAKMMGMAYFESSAKNGENISNIFETLLEELYIINKDLFYKENL